LTTSVVVFWVPNLLSVATIIVLSFTWWAVRKQARAADQLTEATKKQIQANEASAQAAREQVEVARRQIAESLRPILTFSTGLLAGEGKFKNEGGGAALDVWWTYGRWGERISERLELGQRFAPPSGELRLDFDKRKMEAKGLILVYRSLAGITSATQVTGSWAKPQSDYFPDVTEWEQKVTARLLPNPKES